MVTDMVLNTIGGLGLFLFGMELMSDGLKKAAGHQLKQILETMTKKPLMGFTIGFLVTAVIQSSSATTVMLIGLVNAGLLTLRQAICVIFGTNVGTTMTAWLVSLTGLDINITSYVMPAIGIGFLMEALGSTRKIKSTGQILFGFGVLFVGLNFMKDAFAGIEKNQMVVDWLAGLGGKPLLSLLAGIAITLIIQSSSASIAVIQMLAVNSAFGTDWENVLNISIPFILGANIGTTVTAQIAALRTNVGARRTAWAHTMFNVIGTCIAFPFVYFGLYAAGVRMLVSWQLGPQTIGATIAVAHTIFNVAGSIIFLPFSAVYEKLIIALVRPREHELTERPVILETHLLGTPVLALHQARTEIIRMTAKAREAVTFAAEGLSENDIKKLDRARRLETMTDEFQLEITSYLVKLSQRQLNDEVSAELPVLLHVVNDLERIGDHAVNIAEIAERKIENKLTFSESADIESGKMLEEMYSMFGNVTAALEHENIRAARNAIINEGRLNNMQIELRRSHVRRMTEKTCSAESGLIFIDLVDNIEKIGDHLANIAQSVMSSLQWSSGRAKAQYRNLDE